MVRQGALGQALQAADAAKNSKDASAAEEAGRAAAALRKYADESRAEIEAGKSKDPLAASVALAALAKKFSSSPVEQELAALNRKWQDDPALAREREAAGILEQINTAYKSAQKHGDPANPAVAKHCKIELETIAGGTKLLKEKFAETSAFKQAEALCAKLGVKY